MMRIRYRFEPFVSVMAIAFLVSPMGGCGSPDGLPREAVSGDVSVDGTPLKAGFITFLPDSPGVPTQGGGTIVEGKYSIARAQGLVPGKYRIVITSPDDKPEVVPEAPARRLTPVKQVIPVRYNDRSLLTAEVRAGTSNVFEFSLTGK